MSAPTRLLLQSAAVSNSQSPVLQAGVLCELDQFRWVRSCAGDRTAASKRPPLTFLHIFSILVDSSAGDELMKWFWLAFFSHKI